MFWKLEATGDGGTPFMSIWRKGLVEESRHVKLVVKLIMQEGSGCLAIIYF